MSWRPGNASHFFEIKIFSCFFLDFAFSFFVIILIIMMVMIIVVLSSVRTFESYTGQCLCTIAPMRREVVLNDSMDDRYKQKQIVLRFTIKLSKLRFFPLDLSSANHGLVPKPKHRVNGSFGWHQSEMWADSRLLCVSADSVNRYRAKMPVTRTEKREPREGCAGP